MKNLVLFDLDGTLADYKHRLHYINNPVKAADWTSFFEACPKDGIIAHVAALFYLIRHNPAYEVWIASGRSDEVREQTVKWLIDHHLHPDTLLMREKGDHTPDDELKRSWVTSGRIPAERILMIFDDRARVVDMWRGLGLPVLQVAEGDF